MEHKSIWKNFLILTVGSLIVFHLNVASAQSTDQGSGSQDEGCVLEDE